MWDLLGGVMGAQRLLREVWSASRAATTLPGQPEAGHSQTRVMLCDTPVHIESQQFGTDGPVYVNLHENEQTSVRAAVAVLEGGSGRLVRLRSKGRRYVVFWDGARPHAFDPNRIFSDAGIRQTLSRYASLTERAERALCTLREAVLGLLHAPADQPVVALHNNTGTDYSVAEYQAGRRHARDAADVAIGIGQPPEDFFLVTESHWYRRLQQRGFNVVLQSPDAVDDGSLSGWFQQAGRSYINVEARHGRLAAQQAMLLAIASAGAGSQPVPHALVESAAP